MESVFGMMWSMLICGSILDGAIQQMVDGIDGVWELPAALLAFVVSAGQIPPLL